VEHLAYAVLSGKSSAIVFSLMYPKLADVAAAAILAFQAQHIVLAIEVVNALSRIRYESHFLHGAKCIPIRCELHDVLNGFLPAISSKASPHFGHLMMCDARRSNSFG
jgi:hypothetical protein